MAATRLGNTYHRPVINQLFDPPSWIRSSDVCNDNELNWLADYNKQLHDQENENVTLLALTQNGEQDFANELAWPREKVVGLHPGINSRLLRTFSKDIPKQNWIVAISRNNIRKAWGETLKAFAPYSADWQLHIITHTKSDLLGEATYYGIPHEAMDLICDYYLKNEPSSPVPILVQRAKRLVTMGFMEIIQDLAPGGVSEVEMFKGSEPEPE